MEEQEKERIRYIAGLGRIPRTFRRSSCVVDGCTEKPIRSHLVPESWMSFIARQGHVIDTSREIPPPNTRTTLAEQFYESLFEAISRPVGIHIANTASIYCPLHDGDKLTVGLLDNRESNLSLPAEQHILFYKAICFSLQDSELVLVMKEQIAKQRPRAAIEREIYLQRQQIIAHRELLPRFSECLEGKCNQECEIGRRIEFKRLFVRGDGIPTVAAVGCGSGIANCGIEFGCTEIGCKFPKSDFMMACKPMADGHSILIGRTRTNYLEFGYCRGIRKRHSQRIYTDVFETSPPQGTKLEVFISMELIQSSKGFICLPR